MAHHYDEGPPPRLSKTDALKLIRTWECLGISFPRTPAGIETLAEKFTAISGTLENARILSDMVLNGCSRCPTPIELRKIARKRFPPADGLHPDDCDMEDLLR